MQNQFLLDLEIKHGLNETQISKIVDVINQLGIYDYNSAEFQEKALYICKEELLDMPSEELLERLRGLS